MPTEEADRLRADWNPPWLIPTEHFEIHTNLPLAEAIGFGRRLEAFHDLFMSILADVLGENLPLVRRFHDPALVGEPASRPHIVYYFATKQQFIDHLTPNYGDTIKDSLGFYDPPKSGRSGRRRPTSSTTPRASYRSRPTFITRSPTSSCSRRPGVTHTPRMSAITGSSRA